MRQVCRRNQGKRDFCSVALGQLGGWAGDVSRRAFRGGCSFDGETLVQTDRGFTAIVNIKVGDIVLAKNEQTGVESYQEVIATFNERHESTLTLDLISDGFKESIVTTDEHPFYVKGKGFVPAALLKNGNILVLAKGRSATIAGIKKKWVEQTAYNLTINNDHTYFVGLNQIWVHNSCRIATRINLPAWKSISIDMDHIVSGHVAGGLRVSSIKSIFPEQMSIKQIENAIRQAYRNGEKIHTQGDRVLMRGDHGNLHLEMWVNVQTRKIETAYPVSRVIIR
jgi:hypothetical protein